MPWSVRKMIRSSWKGVWKEFRGTEQSFEEREAPVCPFLTAVTPGCCRVTHAQHWVTEENF